MNEKTRAELPALEASNSDLEAQESELNEIGKILDRIETGNPATWTISDWTTWQKFTFGSDICDACRRTTSAAACKRCRSAQKVLNRLFKSI